MSAVNDKASGPGSDHGFGDGHDDVRDTTIPEDAQPEDAQPDDAQPDDTLPPQDAAADTLPPEAASSRVWRRDPDVRARAGLALGGGVAWLVVAAALLPVVVVAALLWPDAAPTAPPSAKDAAHAPERPSVDFAALRDAALAATAANANANAPTDTGVRPRAEPDPSLRAFARLANRVYDARAAWRKGGQSGKELFRTATVEELGGAAFVEELGLGPRRFVWLRREAKVLAPASAQVPDGISMKDGGNDPGPKSFDGSWDGKPVRAIRSCVFGETYCLVDVVDLPPAALATTADAPAAVDPTPPADGAKPLSAFDSLAAREAAKLAAWTPSSAPAAALSPPATRAAPLVALLAGLSLAALLAGLAVARLRGLAKVVIGACARLRAAAAGQPLPHDAAPAAAGRAAELAALEAAIDEAAAALGDGAARAEQATQRRARLAELAGALDQVAGGQRAARVPAQASDDVALAALAASVNAALERFDANALAARPPTPPD